MLHIIQAGSPPPGAQALRAMYEARKRVFVDLLGWNVPVIDGRYEIDQFDDAYCRYLILTDSTGRHFGSARLLPTLRPHILGSLFADLCDGAVPRAADTYEITRFCLERDLSSRDRRAVRDTLMMALANVAIESGIRTYTAIAERPWVDQIQQFGWRCRALGPERRHGRALLSALAIDIVADTPALLAGAGVRSDATLLETERRDAA